MSQKFSVSVPMWTFERIQAAAKQRRIAMSKLVHMAVADLTNYPSTAAEMFRAARPEVKP